MKFTKYWIYINEYILIVNLFWTLKALKLLSAIWLENYHFALTTLSTVGYGDYYPISNHERFVTLIIQLGGVAFFSYIMSSFIEIVANYEAKVGPTDYTNDLNNWLALLTRYTKNNI